MGRSVVVRLMHRFGASLLMASSMALACEVPDEGNMPLRRALTRVQMLPETVQWELARREDNVLVQYRLLLHEQRRIGGKCYWTVEALAGGEIWKRFLVTPDGKSVLKAPKSVRKE
jgi:hypothetical protein